MNHYIVNIISPIDSDEEHELYIENVIEPFIDYIRPMDEINPDYPEVQFSGGAGSWNGESKLFDYSCAFSFPEEMKTKKRDLLLSNIYFGLKCILADCSYTVYLESDSGESKIVKEFT